VLRRIFGRKGKEMKAEWSKSNNKYLPYTYILRAACTKFQSGAMNTI
jgi:hypothetical protein